jgi:hypothetical protein
MRTRFLSISVLAAALVAVVAGPALAELATNRNLSAHAFHAASPADTAYITDNGYVVANTDASNNRGVVADGGWLYLGAGATSYTFTIYGNKSSASGTLTCWATFVGRNGTQYSTGNSSQSSAGLVSLGITTTGLTTGILMAVGILCSLPSTVVLYGADAP